MFVVFKWLFLRLLNLLEKLMMSNIFKDITLIIWNLGYGTLGLWFKTWATFDPKLQQTFALNDRGSNLVRTKNIF